MSARAPFNELPSQHLMLNHDEIEAQYRRIILHIWKEETVFNGELPKDPAALWAKICQHETSDSSHPYEQFAKYALSALSVPVSNAVVERVFSHVTWVKSKYKNKISIGMLDAIIIVRVTLKFKKICCTGMEVTPSMLEKFSSAMYIDATDINNISALE